jgi:hypothetical protein
MYIGGHEKNIISDSFLLREALGKYIQWRSKVSSFFFYLNKKKNKQNFKMK